MGEDRLNPKRQVANWDAAALLKLMWESWNDVFRKTLGPAERSLLSELRDQRNKWAHRAVSACASSSSPQSTTWSSKSHDGYARGLLLDANPGAAIVLTDIMMPGMDGYETIRLIRSNPLFGRLSTISLRSSSATRRYCKASEKT